MMIVRNMLMHIGKLFCLTVFTAIALEGCVEAPLAIADSPSTASASSNVQFTILHAFTGKDGRMPQCGLTLGPDGNFYGATAFGGVADKGTLFRISPAGDFKLLHSFTGPDGFRPTGGLAVGSDGNLYGTTSFGGALLTDADEGGLVYKLDMTGKVTTVHGFTIGDGAANPVSALLRDARGKLYGTAAREGEYYGSIYRVTPAGTFAIVYAFPAKEMSIPLGDLILGSDGCLYGSTIGASSTPTSTIFKITPQGKRTTLHSFGGADGNGSIHLVQCADGTFIGSASVEGPDKSVNRGMGCGTLFTMNAAGDVTRLHAFVGTDGNGPYGLVLASDNCVYGITINGGSTSSEPTVQCQGTVFKMTSTGQIVTLHVFTGPDGALPVGIVQGPDGNLYGTTSASGADGRGGGTVFKITLSK